MKEVKKFIIADVIVLLLKVLAGFICRSNAMLASGIFDLLFIIMSLFVVKRKENSKIKGVITSLVGFFFILGSIGFLFYTFQSKILIPSFFLILFLLISIIVKYLIGCYYTNIHFQQKKGLLDYGTINSTLDFVVTGVILATLIIGKISKWVSIFRYADRVGVVIILVLVIYKAFQLIKNSFQYVEGYELPKVVEDEITSRKEVKKIQRILMNSFGGIRHITIDLSLQESTSLMDVNTFVITLQDYLLKFGDVVAINLVPNVEKKKTKPKVRSLKQDARNSRSKNSC